MQEVSPEEAKGKVFERFVQSESGMLAVVFADGTFTGLGIDPDFEDMISPVFVDLLVFGVQEAVDGGLATQAEMDQLYDERIAAKARENVTAALAPLASWLLEYGSPRAQALYSQLIVETGLLDKKGGA